MPGLKEVEIYLTGIWLLLKGDRQGFSYLDLSDRGVNRSFWSIAWSLPAMIFSWVFWYQALLEDIPVYQQMRTLFFLRMTMIDLASWMLPLILVGFICRFFSIDDRFNALVVTSNWLALPIAYANALLIAISVLMPGLGQVVILLWLLLLLGLVGGVFRLTSAVLDGQTLLVSTITIVMLVPTTLLSEFLERYLDVAPL
ncbi:hypothetical protein [Agrobacterium vitis]|uniref:Yip1 domain-containing protein n=1 Tax=Agrobacterium vitis TaxID=373 RepID=A0A7K1RH00_AGRVI|nr:hypothetical protein [Agrobacterium vitis]MVA57271.1 hypothetical protein [Agrobacterium vitis]